MAKKKKQKKGIELQKLKKQSQADVKKLTTDSVITLGGLQAQINSLVIELGKLKEENLSGVSGGVKIKKEK